MKKLIKKMFLKIKSSALLLFPCMGISVYFELSLRACILPCNSDAALSVTNFSEKALTAGTCVRTTSLG